VVGRVDVTWIEAPVDGEFSPVLQGRVDAAAPVLRRLPALLRSRRGRLSQFGIEEKEWP